MRKEYLVNGYKDGATVPIVGFRASSVEAASQIALLCILKSKELGVRHWTIESFDLDTLNVEWASYE